MARKTKQDEPRPDAEPDDYVPEAWEQFETAPPPPKERPTPPADLFPPPLKG